MKLIKNLTLAAFATLAMVSLTSCVTTQGAGSSCCGKCGGKPAACETKSDCCGKCGGHGHSHGAACKN